MNENMLNIAMVLSYAAQVRVEPENVYLVEGVSPYCKDLDVYGVCVNNNDGTYTLFFYAPIFKGLRVQKLMISEEEYRCANVYQTGDMTHIGLNTISW